MPFQKGHKQLNTGRTHIKKGQHISVKTEFKKGMTSWLKGKHIQTNTGRTHFKKGMISRNKGIRKENSPLWKGDSAVHRKRYYCKELGCNNRICYRNFRWGLGRCKSCSKKGKLSERFGKVFSPHNQKVKYNGVIMRSSWEMLYAKYLDENNIKWWYESKTFDLGNTTYTPDFYLSQSDKYIEIKGFFTDYAQKKISLFRKIFPDINFEILQKPELKQLGVL